MRNYRNQSANINKARIKNRGLYSADKSQQGTTFLNPQSERSTKRQSKTAQSFRRSGVDQMNSSLQLGKKKVQQKIPVFRNSTEELKFQKMKKLQKLGLEDFMKQIIFSNNKTQAQDYTNNIIQAFNKTYVKESHMPSPKPTIPIGFIKKPKNVIRSPRVDWKPEAQGLPYEFKQMQSFIPNTMFPCRKSQTLKLRSRNFGSYQSVKKYQKADIRPSTARESSVEEMKREISQRTKINFSRNKMKEKNTKMKDSFEKRILSASVERQSVIKVKKANIYI